MGAKPQVCRIIAGVLIFAIALAAPVLSAAEQDRPFIVFAAASLTEAVTDVSTAFTEETKIQVKTSFAASSVLAKQIEAGAPATVFFAADEQWMTTSRVETCSRREAVRMYWESTRARSARGQWRNR